MTQIDIVNIAIVDDPKAEKFDTEKKSLIRITIAEGMFFDSPALPKEVAEQIQENLKGMVEKKENTGMYG